MTQHRTPRTAIIASLLLIFALAFASGCSNTTSQVSGQEIKAQLAEKKAVLIDVRTTQEYAAGHAKDALLMPYDQITQTIGAAAPHKDEPIYLYCRSGRRSGIAQDTLVKMGYTQVHNLGAFEDLSQYGIERVKP